MSTQVDGGASEMDRGTHGHSPTVPTCLVLLAALLQTNSRWGVGGEDGN